MHLKIYKMSYEMYFLIVQNFIRASRYLNKVIYISCWVFFIVYLNKLVLKNILDNHFLNQTIIKIIV